MNVLTKTCILLLLMSFISSCAKKGEITTYLFVDEVENAAISDVLNREMEVIREIIPRFLSVDETYRLEIIESSQLIRLFIKTASQDTSALVSAKVAKTYYEEQRERGERGERGERVSPQNGERVSPQNGERVSPQNTDLPPE